MRSRGGLLFTIASTLILVVIVIAWFRSYANETILFESYRGQLLLIGIDVNPKAAREMRDGSTMEYFLSTLRTPLNVNGQNLPTGNEHSFAGFTCITGGIGKVPVPNNDWGSFRTSPYWIVGIPHWFIALIAFTATVLGLRYRNRARNRAKKNHCAQCGYDLRATPDRCPECGHVPVRGSRDPSGPSRVRSDAGV